MQVALQKNCKMKTDLDLVKKKNTALYDFKASKNKNKMEQQGNFFSFF